MANMWTGACGGKAWTAEIGDVRLSVEASGHNWLWCAVTVGGAGPVSGLRDCLADAQAAAERAAARFGDDKT